MSGMKRNLHYFIRPCKGSVWTWNVDHIRQFLHVFGGRRIVVVAEDAGTERMEAVADRFKAPSVEFVRCAGEAGGVQASQFLAVMERLRSSDPQEATFYSYARGVADWTPAVVTVMAWTKAMYVLNLARIDLVDEVLAKHAVVGAFRETSLSGVPWRFSGGFFWVRHSHFFSRNWRDLPGGPRDVEDYPGSLFPLGMSFDLTLGKHRADYRENALSDPEMRSMLRSLRQAVEQPEHERPTGIVGPTGPGPAEPGPDPVPRLDSLG